MDIHDWVKAHAEFSEFDIYDVVGFISDYISDGWKDAQKELPSHEGMVIVYVQFGESVTGLLRKPIFDIACCETDWKGNRKWNRILGGLDSKNVVAWREFPAPPVFPTQKSNLRFLPTAASSQGE